MKALLDTNIVIHRENRRVSNYSIGHLYRWLDILKYNKVIHPYSVSEIQKYRDPETQEAIAVKLESYDVIKTVKNPDEEFLRLLGIPVRSENDKIDNYILYELYLGRVDILITEDRKLRNKAVSIGFGAQVFSINAFISKVTAENPALIEYKMLDVEKTYFGNIDITDNFFDSFRSAYEGFDKWFVKKCDEESYICKNDIGNILGFLYLKTEGPEENFADIYPPFAPKRRLKVGTFKVESTGFRLGERFVKIIFDNAMQRNVEQIYVTLFTDSDELTALNELLQRWGFVHYGIKKSNGKEEHVLIKNMDSYVKEYSPKKNFPNILHNCKKYILPIYPKYHTTLLPDSKLKNEDKINFMGREPHRYALQKVYISWAPDNGVKKGDLILFYRTGDEGTIKKYSSVISTVAIVDEIICNIKSEKELLQICQNRSVFSVEELMGFWTGHSFNIKVLKFIFVKSLTNKLTLGYLWENGIVSPPGGPRSFHKLTDIQFDEILHDSQTEIKYIDC